MTVRPHRGPAAGLLSQPHRPSSMATTTSILLVAGARSAPLSTCEPRPPVHPETVDRPPVERRRRREAARDGGRALRTQSRGP